LWFFLAEIFGRWDGRGGERREKEGRGRREGEGGKRALTRFLEIFSDQARKYEKRQRPSHSKAEGGGREGGRKGGREEGRNGGRKEGRREGGLTRFFRSFLTRLENMKNDNVHHVLKRKEEGGRGRSEEGGRDEGRREERREAGLTRYLEIFSDPAGKHEK
jgi:hypothetical protein